MCASEKPVQTQNVIIKLPKKFGHGTNDFYKIGCNNNQLRCTLVGLLGISGRNKEKEGTWEMQEINWTTRYSGDKKRSSKLFEPTKTFLTKLMLAKICSLSQYFTHDYQRKLLLKNTGPYVLPSCLLATVRVSTQYCGTCPPLYGSQLQFAVHVQGHSHYCLLTSNSQPQQNLIQITWPHPFPM